MEGKPLHWDWKIPEGYPHDLSDSEIRAFIEVVHADVRQKNLENYGPSRLMLINSGQDELIRRLMERTGRESRNTARLALAIAGFSLLASIADLWTRP